MTSIAHEIPTTLPTNVPGTSLLIGKTPAMQQVAHYICALAQTERTSAIILGESGSGKELVARAIHALSRRALSPFVPLNCATIPGQLAEAELFGTEAGAFTDARARQGVIEQAHTGTLFLDEIGELPAVVQTTLLRFLEKREFRRLGGHRLLTADVRIIAATWRDLAAAITEGAFRLDLLYRINVMTIMLPPLRERQADLPTLVTESIQHVAQRLQLDHVPTCSHDALALLVAYDWPGNVRELQNVIERALILGHGTPITSDHLPDTIRFPRPASAPPPLTLAEQIAAFTLPPEGTALLTLVHQLEATLLHQAMERTSANQSQAAALLGISRDQLRQRLRRRHG